MEAFKIVKWGNSYAVRLPARMMKEHGWKEGDTIEADVLALRKRIVSMTREEALRIMRETRWKLPEDYKFDREEANAR